MENELSRHTPSRCIATLLITVTAAAFLASTQACAQGSAGAIVTGYCYYSRAQGDDMINRYFYSAEPDTITAGYQRFSTDNGATWDTAQVLIGGDSLAVVDPYEDLLVNFGYTDSGSGPALHYTVSDNGGASTCLAEPVICRGGAYSQTHPLPGVWLGSNVPLITSLGQPPIVTQSGTLLQPIHIEPLDGPAGNPINPGGGATWHDAAVLIGSWFTNGQGQRQLQWGLSQLVVGDPSLSTRGFFEPTLAEMPDGRLLMIMRGSNDANLLLPARKWMSVSTDGGHTWSAPAHWTYENGLPFYSASSSSQLLRMTDGRVYWVGNICATNPTGDSPNYPLAIGLVDTTTLLLVEQTVTVIDDRCFLEPTELDLDEFQAYVDRQGREIVIVGARAYRNWPELWLGSLYQLRVQALEPASCLDVWQQGFGIPADLNQDCIVDFLDLSVFFTGWLQDHAEIPQ